MQYRLLGRTELRVSEIGCGGAPLGIPHYNEVWDSYAEDTTRSVIAALQRAVELGYNYFDTTPSYGEGRSEELMGEALAGQRHEVYLASKTEWKDQTRESILRRVEGSLRRLQTDYLDVLQFHGSDYTPDDVRFILEGGPMEAYQQLKQAGTIRFIGITAEEPVTLMTCPLSLEAITLPASIPEVPDGLETAVTVAPKPSGKKTESAPLV